MLGVPRAIGELRAGLREILGQLEDKIAVPARELFGDLNPLDPVIEWIKNKVTEYLKDVVEKAIREKFGIDIEAYEALLKLSPESLLDAKSIMIDGKGIALFDSTAHERLDRYLGFAGTSHLEDLDEALLDQSVVQFWPNAHGRLKQDVEFDKTKFAAYANALTLGKMSLLQETLVGADPVAGLQPKTISKLLSDVGGQPYDFATMTLNGQHGGNVLTATMPGAVDSIIGRPVRS
jgi:hypothetical protein